MTPLQFNVVLPGASMYVLEVGCETGSSLLEVGKEKYHHSVLDAQSSNKHCLLKIYLHGQACVIY